MNKLSAFSNVTKTERKYVITNYLTHLFQCMHAMSDCQLTWKNGFLALPQLP